MYSVTKGVGMPIRKKAIILVALILVNFFGSLGLTLYVDQRFLWSVVLLPTLFALLLLALRCEKCGKPVYKNRINLLGVSFTYWGGFNPLPRKCTQCGFDFTETLLDRSAGAPR
jgi:hypothetical protein